MINIVVAMSPNHAIGIDGRLPWRLPEDFARFRRLTVGHTVVMGRKTFESLPHGALPYRRNIVLSKSAGKLNGAEVCRSLEEALEKSRNDKEVCIIGGADVYSQAMPLADTLYITLVKENPAEADTFFPHFDKNDWQEKQRETHDGFSFITLARKKQSPRKMFTTPPL